MAAEPARNRLLGRGGMGVVHEGDQPHLGRVVAIKQVRQDRRAPKTTKALLDEARLTSAVAHPAVIPVHSIELDEAGEPRIVLKRIQGRPWSRLLRDASLVVHHLDRDDVLPFHIEVLEQVAAAVHAAHRRGILHRDLKPSNVMVDHHGQVYVLDWGLGVSIDPDADPRLPRVREGRSAGTPHYMAPEMVSKRFGELGPHTDVFLLGGLLFHVLYGRPPHQGRNVWNALVEACRKGVTFPDAHAPEDLVVLCRQCLERRPKDRPARAEDVRRALRRWLDRLPSHRLADEARLEAEVLETLVGAHRTGDLDAEAEPQVHAAFGAAVFASRRALEAWPENAVAQEAHERAVRVFVDWALDGGRTRMAQAALTTLDPPPPDIAGRVASALRPHAIPIEARGVVAVLVTVGLVAPVVLALGPLVGVPAHVALIVLAGGGLAGSLAAASSARAQGLSPRGRTLVALGFLGLAAMLLTGLLAGQAVVPALVAIEATLTVAAASAVHPRLRFTVLGYLAAAVVAVFAPAAGPVALALAGAFRLAIGARLAAAVER